MKDTKSLQCSTTHTIPAIFDGQKLVFGTIMFDVKVIEGMGRGCFASEGIGAGQVVLRCGFDAFRFLDLGAKVKGGYRYALILHIS